MGIIPSVQEAVCIILWVFGRTNQDTETSLKHDWPESVHCTLTFVWLQHLAFRMSNSVNTLNHTYLLMVNDKKEVAQLNTKPLTTMYSSPPAIQLLMTLVSAWPREGVLCRLILVGRAATVALFSHSEQESVGEGWRWDTPTKYVCKNIHIKNCLSSRQVLWQQVF